MNKVSLEVVDGSDRVKTDVVLRYPEAFPVEGK
jgi:hypothetical protein